MAWATAIVAKCSFGSCAAHASIPCDRSAVPNGRSVGGRARRSRQRVLDARRSPSRHAVGRPFLRPLLEGQAVEDGRGCLGRSTRFSATRLARAALIGRLSSRTWKLGDATAVAASVDDRASIFGSKYRAKPILGILGDPGQHQKRGADGIRERNSRLLRQARLQSSDRAHGPVRVGRTRHPLCIRSVSARPLVSEPPRPVGILCLRRGRPGRAQAK